MVAHSLLRAHYEGDEQTQAENRPTVERMCRLVESRRAEVVAQWVRHMAELLPQRRNASGGIPAWWSDLGDRFLHLLMRHLADPDDVACHRFVRVLTRAANRAGYTAADLACTQVALKRTLVAELVVEFGNEPEALRVMCDRLESEIDHIRLHVAECFYEHNERELLKAEQRRWALFNSAGDAVLLVDPADGRLVDANREAEALFGLNKGELLATHYAELFSASSRRALNDRLSATMREGTSFLDRGTLTSAEGKRIPASVRSSVIDYGGSRIVQSLVHDETGGRRMDESPVEHGERLEGMVAARTRELHLAQRKFRRLYGEERRQVARMAILREIAEAALRTRTADDLLTLVAASIRRHFRYYDVSIFSVGQEGECTLRAHAGTYENVLRDGYRHAAAPGLIGEAVRTYQAVLANDVSKDPRYVPAFPAARRSRSQLVVPVVSNDRCIAALDVLSQQLNAFDDGDLAIMQAVAGQLALGLEKVSLHEATLRAQEFSEQIIQGMPSSLIAVDRNDCVRAVNERFGREAGVDVDEAVGKHLTEVVEEALPSQASLMDMLAQARRTGETVERQALHHSSPSHPDRFLDIRVKPLAAGQGADALIVINNVTESSRRIFQMELIYRVTQLLQSSLDEDYVLHATLTCVTAGPALGFNRAFVLLADGEQGVLRGRVAVGPKDEADAGRIYTDLAQHSKDLKELVAQYAGPRNPEPGSLHELVLGCRIPLVEAGACPVAQVFFDRKPRRFTRDEHPFGPDCCALSQIMDAEEFAVAVLEAGDSAIGLVVADNRFTRAPIGDEEVRLLATVARQAGLALANARAHAEVARNAEQLSFAYKQLREAHDDLVRHEKLAAAGEMSARVSHEIRNPLVTIGGFARSILRDPEASEKSVRNARIMVEEVEKLESFLTNWLDLARPPDSVQSPEDLNAVVEHALLMANVQSLPDTVRTTKDLDATLPPVVLDARRLQQALVNVILNAIQALNGGGEITVRTRLEQEQVRIEVADTGVGIPDHVRSQIFQPFFTTKLSGSGLGLAVAEGIVEDHGGSIAIRSAEGEGTTVTIRLPLVGGTGGLNGNGASGPESGST